MTAGPFIFSKQHRTVFNGNPYLFVCGIFQDRFPDFLHLAQILIHRFIRNSSDKACNCIDIQHCCRVNDLQQMPDVSVSLFKFRFQYIGIICQRRYRNPSLFAVLQKIPGPVLRKVFHIDMADPCVAALRSAHRPAGHFHAFQF